MKRTLVVAALALGACSSPKPPPASNPPGPPTVPPSPSLSSPPSPTPAPSPTVFALGQPGLSPVVGAKVTVYSWDTNVRWPITPPPGGEFSEIDAKVCSSPLTSGDISEFALSFSLEFAGSRRIGAESEGFNSDELLTQHGQLQGCVRGKVIFEQAAHARPRFAIYSGSSGDLRWRVKG